MTNRYFADGVSAVTASGDKSVVSLTFANQPRPAEDGGVPEEAFEVVLPTAGFLALAKFFEGLKERLEIAPAAEKGEAEGK